MRWRDGEHDDPGSAAGGSMADSIGTAAGKSLGQLAGTPCLILLGESGSGQTYAGVSSNFYSELGSVTGMFYLSSRLYYALNGQSGLFWRWCTSSSTRVTRRARANSSYDRICARRQFDWAGCWSS